MSDFLTKDIIAKLKKLSKQLDELKNASVIPSVDLNKDLDNKYYDSTQMRHLFHFSDSKLQALRNQKKLPCIKIGRKYLYPTRLINSMFNN